MTIGKPFKKGQSGNPGGRPKVVAEVKELATQTSEATEEISGQIEAMLNAAGVVITAIEAVGNGRLNAASGGNTR